MSGNGERQKRAASAGVARLSKQASEKWDVLEALPPVEGARGANRSFHLQLAWRVEAPARRPVAVPYAPGCRARSLHC